MFFMLLEFIVALMLITQILWPVVTMLIPGLDEEEFFWVFKKDKKQAPIVPISSLSDLAQEVDQSVTQFKSTKAKVDDAENTIKSLKDKTK
jgi:hypothetical protein